LCPDEIDDIKNKRLDERPKNISLVFSLLIQSIWRYRKVGMTFSANMDIDNTRCVYLTK